MIIFSLLLSATASASSFLAGEGHDRDRVVDCLDAEVSRQLPSSVGTVFRSDPLESINSSDRSVIDFHFYTRLSSGTQRGWYLKLKLSSGIWRYMVNSTDGTVSEYSSSNTLPTAAFVDEDSGAQAADIDVTDCSKLWTN